MLVIGCWLSAPFVDGRCCLLCCDLLVGGWCLLVVCISLLVVALLLYVMHCVLVVVVRSATRVCNVLFTLRLLALVCC